MGENRNMALSESGVAVIKKEGGEVRKVKVGDPFVVRIKRLLGRR